IRRRFPDRRAVRNSSLLGKISSTERVKISSIFAGSVLIFINIYSYNVANYTIKKKRLEGGSRRPSLVTGSSHPCVSLFYKNNGSSRVKREPCPSPSEWALIVPLIASAIFWAT